MKKLMKIFKEKTMIIFDAILREKRVLFTGGRNITAQQLVQSVCAAAMLVSPPLFSVLSRVFPHCIWSDLDFLSVKGFIAGTKNPLFRMRANWYDICCDLETGCITGKCEDYFDQKYYNDDCEFIEQLLERVADRQIGEDELRFAFSEYTRSILEIAMGESEYVAGEMDYFLESQWTRIFALKRTFCKDLLVKLKKEKEMKTCAGASLARIERHVRKLRLCSTPLSNEDLFSMLEDISKYLDGPEQILDFLALLPKYSEGLHLMGIGLFSADEAIVRKTIEILNKIQKLRVGKEIFANLNINVQEVYYRKVSFMVLDSNTSTFSK